MKRRQQPAALLELPPVSEAATNAIVFAGLEDVRYAEVPLPSRGEFDLLIDTTLSAISSGTERWALIGKRPETKFPCIPGYLATGTVKEVGAKADGYASGERVLMFASRPPEGYGGNWMCSHLAQQVVSRDPADHMPDADLPYCWHIPEGVSDDDAVFAGLAAVALQGIRSLTIEPGAKAAVLGLGMVGQFSVQLVANAGAEVAAVDLHPGKTIAAKRIGAKAAIVASTSDYTSRMQEFAPEGFDVIIDTTANAAAVGSAVYLLKQGGQLLMEAWYPGQTTIELTGFHVKAARVFFTCGLRGGDVKECLHLMSSGKLQAAPLITHRFVPSEAPDAYKMLVRNDPAAIGVVFDW